VLEAARDPRRSPPIEVHPGSMDRHRVRRPSDRANATCSCIAVALYLMVSALSALPRHWRVTLRIINITARCPAHRSTILPEGTALELPRRKALAVEMELVEVAAASLPIDRELNLELHLRLPDGHLAHRARCVNAGASPDTIRRSGGQFPFLYSGAGFRADDRFIKH
jgi:hypothetical protein